LSSDRCCSKNPEGSASLSWSWCSPEGNPDLRLPRCSALCSRPVYRFRRAVRWTSRKVNSCPLAMPVLSPSRSLPRDADCRKSHHWWSDLRLALRATPSACFDNLPMRSSLLRAQLQSKFGSSWRSRSLMNEGPAIVGQPVAVECRASALSAVVPLPHRCVSTAPEGRSRQTPHTMLARSGGILLADGWITGATGRGSAPARRLR
jgi:hypothetical protein